MRLRADGRKSASRSCMTSVRYAFPYGRKKRGGISRDQVCGDKSSQQSRPLGDLLFFRIVQILILREMKDEPRMLQVAIPLPQ